MTYQTLGIILKKADQVEADQLFSIYPERNVKVLAIGRGTKKIRSKLNGSLRYFAVLDLLVASGKRYDHIAGVQVITNFPAIQNDLKKIILASFALELVEKLTKVGQPDDKIFTLLLKYFSALGGNSFGDQEWQIIRRAFMVKLLSLLGFAPQDEIISDVKKLDNFLKNHLDSELLTEKFLVKIST